VLGGRILVKAEGLQRTHSFKFRGAFNRISLIDPTECRNGVAAYSSGNHAQGVAAAAQCHGIPAVIVMPRDAPAMKIDNTRAYGAEVVLYDRKTESREAIGERIAEERSLTLVRPYDDPDVIAGQGTLGLELAEQARRLDADIDAVLVPVSGGGLVAGCALALERECPRAAVYAVEPDAYDDTCRSLAAGRRLRHAENASSICDALQVPTPGELTFSINARLLAGGVTVSDDDALAAMACAFRYFKLVVEPGGGVGLAALLAKRFDCRGKTVAVVCSGGNVDAALFGEALDRYGNQA
jgi:threonine dehydratase